MATSWVSTEYPLPMKVGPRLVRMDKMFDVALSLISEAVRYISQLKISSDSITLRDSIANPK